MSGRWGSRALTGNQVVIIVLAICAALVLAPVGVYAAATQKVAIADARKPTRTVTVDGSGRLTTVTSGTVATVPRPPAQPFHVGRLVPAHTATLGLIPRGRRLAITSLSTAWLNGMTTADGRAGMRIVLRKASSSGACPSAGPAIGTVVHFLAPVDNTNPVVANLERTFPTPQVWRATDRTLCLQVDAGVAGFPVVVDGYLL